MEEDIAISLAWLRREDKKTAGRTNRREEEGEGGGGYEPSPVAVPGSPIQRLLI